VDWEVKADGRLTFAGLKRPKARTVGLAMQSMRNFGTAEKRCLVSSRVAPQLMLQGRGHPLSITQEHENVTELFHSTRFTTRPFLGTNQTVQSQLHCERVGGNVGRLGEGLAAIANMSTAVGGHSLTRGRREALGIGAVSAAPNSRRMMDAAMFRVKENWNRK